MNLHDDGVIWDNMKRVRQTHVQKSVGCEGCMERRSLTAFDENNRAFAWNERKHTTSIRLMIRLCCDEGV